MHVQALCDVMKRQGITFGAGVPCSVFTPFVNHISADPRFEYITASSEGEAVAIAAGSIAAGRPSFALMQNSGLGNAVNPLTSLLYIYKIPVMLLISLRGGPGTPDEPQHELMGQITEQLARLCELRTHILAQETFQTTLEALQEEGVSSAWICPRGLLDGGPESPPISLKVRSDTVTPENTGVFEPSLSREDALEAILPILNRGCGNGDGAAAVISTTGKLSRELYELDDRDHGRFNRFYMVGSMGCASSFGLGIATGLPDRKVIVLDGDGALLMKLGSLATIGHVEPGNFHHLIFDNGAYDSTGGQPTSSPGVDFAVVALACGYRLAETASGKDDIVDALDRHLSREGPTLLRIAVLPGARRDLGRPKLSPRDVWLRFISFLSSGEK